VLAALRLDGLIDSRHRVEGAQLCWQVADRWPTDRVYLARVPGRDAATARPLRLGLDDVEATADLDIVDRLRGEAPQLQVLRAARGTEPAEPAGVLLPTPYGQVKVDGERRPVRSALGRFPEAGN
jgi:hypothetical protein